MKFLSIFLGAVFAANGHGWNDNIDWVTLDEAKEASKTNGKPTMLVIHKRCDLSSGSSYISHAALFFSVFKHY